MKPTKSPLLGLFSCAALLFALSPFASPFAGIAGANEIKGIEVPEKITAGNCNLILNGTAVRSVWGFGVYVAGLYLEEPNEDEKAIMTHDQAGKRVHMTMLREVSAEKFESTIHDNIVTNFSAGERRRFSAEMEKFLDCFGGGAQLQKGTVINIDYLPGKGMQVSVDGRTFDLIPGHDFYHAILRLWIGKPPQESVKIGLLGMAG